LGGTVKPKLTLLACVLLLASASAQQGKATSEKSGSSGRSAVEKVLEAKIRKAWEDYKKRDKQAFSAILADGFGEVTNDSDGIFGKDVELAEMDKFNLTHYELKDFQFRPVGSSGIVVTYNAEYSGSYENSPMQMKTVYGEVWLRAGNDWKLLWVQETKIK
jgi:hypothetical protein